MQRDGSLHLQTQRLLLRPLWPDDLPLAAQIMRNPRIVFWRKKRVSLNEIRAGIKRSKKMNDWGLGWWLIFDLQSNRLVGSAMLQPLENTFEIEIGYHILPEFWGHGYASEAARQVLAHGFEILGLPNIRAVILPRNRPSLRLIEKLGFGQRGTLLHVNLLHRYFKLERAAYIERQQISHLPKIDTS
ncbi:MAG: GNAT family N-acetyltransferase [Hyphomicrobiaceae bacterium]|nr:GNAT family N-acetyltransferase [Hyphomicrobiaceae bacterium]